MISMHREKRNRPNYKAPMAQYISEKRKYDNDFFKDTREKHIPMLLPMMESCKYKGVENWLGAKAIVFDFKSKNGLSAPLKIVLYNNEDGELKVGDFDVVLSER